MQHILPIVHAFQEYRKLYSNQGSDYSATDLINPVRVVILKKRYRDEIANMALDIATTLNSFRGTAIHNLLEWMHKKSGLPYVSEKRIKIEIMNRTISGQFDTLFGLDMYDYKTTSVWKRIFSDTTEWEQQQNIYAYLLNTQDLRVNSINIIAWYQDWKEKERFKEGYPQDPVEQIRLNLWSVQDQKAFIHEKVRSLIAAEDMEDHELPECTAEDMWAKDSKYAVMQRGNEEKAKRVLNSQAEAEAWIAKSKLSDLYIQFRPGERTRCDKYCDASHFCSQYREYLQGKDLIHGN